MSVRNEALFDFWTKKMLRILLILPSVVVYLRFENPRYYL